MPVDQMPNYEAGLKSMDALVKYYSENIGSRNEATTRLHLIDTLLFDCLGWAKHDAYAEEPREKEYTDYSFFAPRRVMILEAKREGDYFEVPAGFTSLTYSIKTMWRGNPSLSAAIKQVARYCQTRGVPLAVVSNGHQVVAFVGNRSDGEPPLDGRCLVFPSLHFMRDHFLDLWNALSRHGVEQKNLQTRLMGEIRPRLPSSLAAELSTYPGTKGRNVFQTDLQLISELVIEDIATSSDLEERFLRECYCPSGALSQHSLGSKYILAARYAALFDDASPRPVAVPATTKAGISRELVAESLSKRPVLFIGDVGVGKTTFIKHLISVEAADVFVNAIALYVDLGSQAALSSDLREFLLSEIEQQLLNKHLVNIEDGGFVRGVYHADLVRFQRGIHGHLRETDERLYREKELALLEGKIRNKAEHLRASLEHLSKARKKQIVVFIDNADQRGEATQDDAFIVAQEMAAHWPALVFVPLRPETFHRSVQGGALSGYHPKAFTIAPPRVDRVIEKRLKFAIQLIGESESFLPLAGIRSVQISHLSKILSSFLVSLVRSNGLLECIDNIAGGNVRRALDLVKGFFGSGHVDTQNIVACTSDDEPYIVALHEFLRATIFGDAVYYDPIQSPVANLFDVCECDSKEHFLLPMLLGLLRHAMASRTDHGFLETETVYDHLQGLAFTPDQIDYAVVRAYRKKLIETPASQSPETQKPMPRSFRITPIGLYHVDRLCSMFAYVDAMTVVTPVFDSSTRDRVIDVHDIEGRLERVACFEGYLTQEWDRFGGKGSMFNWKHASKGLREDMEMIVGKKNAKRRSRR